jgi:hypothetical protein
MAKGVGSRTALYRFYGAGDQLLYVGITERLGKRWETHMRNKPWWPDVRRQTVHWHPTRAQASEAEVAAIVDEKPLYNVVHSTRHRGGVDVVTALSALDAAARAIAHARALIEPAPARTAAPRKAGPSGGAIDTDKLLSDLPSVVGSARVRLSVLPELLRQVDPLYLPYRKITGSHIAQALRSRGIRVTNTGNVRRLDPADLRLKAS